MTSTAARTPHPVSEPSRKDSGKAARAAELRAANINPRTGLATDYLNHFNEAIMLLEMIPDMSYREHFTASSFRARELAVAAYDSANPAIRDEFDSITGAMTSILTAVGAAMREARHDRTRAMLASQATGWVKPLVTLAGGIINGKGIQSGDEADVDYIMTH
jgi:fermentation-respiration switch protein FrsA (DUF1100 family)